MPTMPGTSGVTPLWLDTPRSAAVQDIPGVRSASRSERTHVNVLLVEDDPDLRLLIQAILAELGHDVSSFSDAETAWDAIERGQEFPLMILDWMLPGMDGLELCRRVRAGSTGADPVVIVITARQERDHLGRILDAGA